MFATFVFDRLYKMYSNFFNSKPDSIIEPLTCIIRLAVLEFKPENTKEIMTDWALLLNGKYRENNMPSGLWNYVEKYVRTNGNGQDGLYTYSFSLNTGLFNIKNCVSFLNLSFSSKIYLILNIPNLDQ